MKYTKHFYLFFGGIAILIISYIVLSGDPNWANKTKVEDRQSKLLIPDSLKPRFANTPIVDNILETYFITDEITLYKKADLLVFEDGVTIPYKLQTDKEGIVKSFQVQCEHSECYVFLELFGAGPNDMWHLVQIECNDIPLIMQQIKEVKPGYQLLQAKMKTGQKPKTTSGSTSN